MANKFKFLTIIFSVFAIMGIYSSVIFIDAGTIRCKLGACNTDADCYGAMNGGLAVCREDGRGFKECANAFCPYGMTVPGANCDCSAGRTCGQTCNASVGLCEDGKSTCRYIVGPNCRVSQPNGVDETTYCVPGGAPGIQTYKCVARDQLNSYALYYGANPTVADLAYACTFVACKPVNPTPATLTSPANNASVTLQYNDSQIFSYNVNTGWGTACPANNNTYDLQLSYNCNGVYSSYGQVTQVFSLQRGVSYCWRVAKDNGSGTKVYSAVNRFYVVDDRATLLLNGIRADVCGNNFSGQNGIAGVSNPIEYGYTFSAPSGNTFKEAWIAMVPDNNVYNQACPAFGGGTTISNNVCQNMEAANTQIDTLILQKAKNANGAAFKMILDASGNSYQAVAYNGVGWNATTSGNVSGLGATLLDFKIASGSGALVQGNQLSANFKIRFDSVPLGKYSFYIAALYQDANGNIKTSYSIPGSTANIFKKVAATTSSSNWGVDLIPPASTSAFTSVKYLAADKFQVNWNINEPNSLQLKSFVTRDNPDSSLTDGTSGVIDFSITPPNADFFNNGQQRYVDITSWNGYVTQSSMGLRTYTDGDPTKQSNYQFLAYARDLACNQKVVSTSAALQKPWVLSYNGNLSAAKGIIGLSVPTGLDQLSDILKGRGGSTVLSDKQSVFLSTYATISGTTDIPLRKQSKLQQYVTRYEDLSIKPSADSGYTKWYDYIYDLVGKNAAAPIKTVAATTLSGNTSAFLGVAAGTKTHALINGKLTVNSGTICDTQTIFFVSGNSSITLDSGFPNTTIKFNPDFTVSGNNNGCIFVTLGDILVDKGSNANSSAPLIDDSTLSNYDLIEAGLITDGQFITTKDVVTTTQKGEGLMIKGSVTADNTYLQRDINLNSNQLQPAQVFSFDPRYRDIFKNDLNYNKYSIRESGFSN